MQHSTDSELQAALQAVRLAAVVCRNVQSAITTEALAKKDNSPVTVADYASQALVCQTLHRVFSNDPIIGEEGAAELREPAGAAFLARIVDECAAAGVRASGSQICDWIDRGGEVDYSGRFWTLDPIDGTKGFLRREQYAIALALIVDGHVQVGVLGCPNMSFGSQPANATGTIAWAVRGQGSWMQPLLQPEVPPQRISVTATADSREARFCESVEAGHSSHDWSGLIAATLGITREPFRIDSQCKYLAVARGEADLYLRLPTRKGYQEKIWDHAAGVLIVEEAGGCVTDIHGRAPEFSHGSTLAANVGMVVTNGRFHQQVVAAVQKHAPTELR